MTWSSPPTKGTVPGKRDYHSMVNFDDKHLVLFGGAFESNEIIHYSDVHIFSTGIFGRWRVLGGWATEEFTGLV